MSPATDRLRRLAHDGDDTATESSPLLHGENPLTPRRPKPIFSWGRSQRGDSKQKSSWRWPSIVAMVVLAMLTITIIVLGFVAPPAVQKYAENAAVIEPTNLSIESINSKGVRARIQANVRLEGSRVDDDNARRLGRFVTGIMRKLETKETKVSVYLPGYDNALFGFAILPPLTIDLVDGHNNALDFVTDLSPGDADNIRKIANDWLKGNLKQLTLTGKTKLALKSGIFPLGTHDIAESMVFEAKGSSSIPDYKIERLNFHDVPVGEKGRKAVAADVSISVRNDFPVSLDLPPLGFEVLVPNCDPSEPSIVVAEGLTGLIEIHANSDVKADAKGIMSEIPESLTRVCPSTESSPLDNFMKQYLNGEDAKVYVRGKGTKDLDTPDWIGEILKDIVSPIAFPGKSFGNFIRNFTLSDVNFKLPDPFAGPNDPHGQPEVSGVASVLAALPSEFNLDLGVEGLRATADLFFEKNKFGVLDLHRWQDAKSVRLHGDEEELLNITSTVVDAPINITNGTVFSDLMQKMLFGDEDLMLDVDASVDVKVVTVLGIFKIKEVPAQGKIPVKRLPGDIFSKMNPEFGNIDILQTSETGIHMQASVNITNPTEYTAVIPYLSIHLLRDGEVLGQAITKNFEVKKGNNTGVVVSAIWDPALCGGKNATIVGRKLLSDYVSGKNTTMVARAHRDSIPKFPIIGEALSKINITIPTPHIGLPGDSHTRQRFIKDAVFHLFTSTATFGLVSPLEHNTLYIDHINATAYYNHTEPVGQIITHHSFPVLPGLSDTPRLPVTWSPSSVGRERLRDALGGELKLDAEANVTVRVGQWTEVVHYTGQGIGAKVSL